VSHARIAIIAALLAERGAHWILTVKGNQPHLVGTTDQRTAHP